MVFGIPSACMYACTLRDTHTHIHPKAKALARHPGAVPTPQNTTGLSNLNP